FPSCVTMTISPPRRYFSARRVLSLTSTANPARSSSAPQFTFSFSSAILAFFICLRPRQRPLLLSSSTLFAQHLRQGRTKRRLQGRGDRGEGHRAPPRCSFPCGRRMDAAPVVRRTPAQ